MTNGLHIDCRHAGGNIVVIGTDGDRVRLKQDNRDSSEWFYWNFAARSATEQMVAFDFGDNELIGPWGPAYSSDGLDWDWLGADSLLSRSSFRYRFRAGERAYFSFALPYQAYHFERFHERIAGHPLVRRKVLAVSEQLRPVPLLLVGNRASDRHIVLTCRHHACESTPSYMLEGLLDYYLNKPASPALERFLFHYVPFVDIDGVENGDQGKNRAPHDHNRDYIDSPIYRSTAAIADYVRPLHLQVGIDFHGPYKWGGRNDVPFFAKSASPVKEETEKLCAHLRAATSGSGIAYDPAYDVEMGVDFNQPHGRSCSALFERSDARIACTFEFPYFGTGDAIFTPSSCRQFGARFAQALERYLESAT